MKICMFCKNEINDIKITNDICSALCAVEISLKGKINNDLHWYQNKPIVWDGTIYYGGRTGTRKFIYETLIKRKLDESEILWVNRKICSVNSCIKPEHLYIKISSTELVEPKQIPPNNQLTISPNQYDYPILENYMRYFTSIMSKLPDRILKDRMHLRFQDFLLQKLCAIIISKDPSDDEINTYISCLHNIKPKLDK